MRPASSLTGIFHTCAIRRATHPIEAKIGTGRRAPFADYRHCPGARQHVGSAFPELVEALPNVPIIDRQAVA